MADFPTAVPNLTVVEDFSPLPSHSVYMVGSGPKGIVYIPDIFGATPQAYHGADALAKQGFLVCMPDFFDGAPWPIADFPPKDGFGGDAFQAFLDRLEYPRQRSRLCGAIATLAAHGATSVGAVGFGWGGKLAMQALGEGLIQSAASAHPRFVTPADARALQGPFCLMPTRDDGPMESIRLALNPAYDAHHVYKHFDDMHHGFASARGDLTNANNRKRVAEAFDLMARFFHDTL